MFMVKELIKTTYENQDTDPQVRTEMKDIFGMFRVVSDAPTGKPRKLIDQIVIYTNGATFRLYYYDFKAGVWHYITATA